MSCYSIVKLNLDVKATPDEIEEALKEMGLAIQSKSATAIVLIDGATLSRADANSAWSVIGASFDTNRFRREVARAKVLNEAKRQGYRITRDERQGDKIVLRMKVT